jgi:hypothetical protein
MQKLDEKGLLYYKDCAAERRLLLKLPTGPKTIAELRVVRYWMRQLSQTHFTHGAFQSTQPTGHRDRDHQAAPFNHALFDELFPDKNKNGGRGDGFYFSFGTLEAFFLLLG